MSTLIHYGYGSCEDEPFTGHYTTFEEAALAAFDNEPDAHSMWICEGHPVSVKSFINADRIFEDIVERASEEVGEVCEGWLEKIQVAKEEEFAELIAGWINSNFPPKFWLAKNAIQVFRKDYPDAKQLPED